MPPFRGTIEKYMAAQGEYWTNVYWLLADNIDNAHAALGQVVTAERALYTQDTTITKSRTDDAIEDTDEYRTTVHNLVGSLTRTTQSMLPLFNVARVDFSVAGGGRPSRKYLRGVLMEESMTNFGVLDASTISLLQTYGDTVHLISATVDVDGQAFISAAPWPRVAMRQLRRGSKKKVTPSSGGIPL